MSNDNGRVTNILIDRLVNGVSVTQNTSPIGIITSNRQLPTTNDLSGRKAEFFRAIFDPRRDIYDECGYPRGYVPPEAYQELFERSVAGARVCEVLSKQSWKKPPTVFESKDTKDKTAFEEAWDKLGGDLGGEQSWYKDEEYSPIWEYLMRADVLCGIGQYGCIFLGIDDDRDLSQPADTLKEEGSIPKEVPKEKNQPETPKDAIPPPSAGVSSPAALNQFPRYKLTVNEDTPKRKLVYIRVFPETQARVVAYESNRRSPRFGRPTMYAVTFQDPNNYPSGGGVAVGYTPTTLNVHWTRMVHVVDNYHQATSSEIAAAPRMRPVLNHILALEKVYGGSGEAYWTSSVPKTVIETHPQLGGDVNINKAELRNELENLHNSLQKFLILMGMAAKTLPPQIVDPTAYAKVHWEAIAIKLGVPMRILLGSERGELSSAQDDGENNDNVRGRNTSWTAPKLIVPMVNRCILLKCLPAPEQFSLWWDDQEVLDPAQKATVAKTRAETMALWVEKSLGSLIGPQDFLVEELGYEEERAQAILDAAAKHQEEMAQEAQDLADEFGMEPAAPEGFEKPEPPAPIKVREGERLVQPKPPAPPKPDA
jgi:hypothetical protein